MLRPLPPARCPTSISPSACSTATWTAGGGGCRTHRCPRRVRPDAHGRAAGRNPVRSAVMPGSVASRSSAERQDEAIPAGADRRRCRRRAAGRAVADGRPARTAPPSAPWCTPCWRPPTRRPTDLLGRADTARSREQIARRGARCSPPNSWPPRCCRCCTPRSARSPPASPCADIAVRDRLPEMDFEIPLAGGDDGVAPGHGDGGRRHHAGRAGAGDPPASAARRSAATGTRTGWRRRHSAGSRCAVTSPAAWTRSCGCPGPRYLVVDYKTNWLGDVDGAPIVGVALPARRRWTR